MVAGENDDDTQQYPLHRQQSGFLAASGNHPSI